MSTWAPVETRVQYQTKRQVKEQVLDQISNTVWDTVYIGSHSEGLVQWIGSVPLTMPGAAQNIMHKVQEALR